MIPRTRNPPEIQRWHMDPDTARTIGARKTVFSIPDAQIDVLISIWKSEFGESIRREDAHHIARRLTALYRTLLRPLPSADKGTGHLPKSPHDTHR